MAQFAVVTEAVADAGTRLGTIPSSVGALHARLGGCSGAAAGTPAADAYDGLLGRWTAVLPHFALAGGRLAGAMANAAQAYAVTDAVTADSAARAGSGEA